MLSLRAALLLNRHRKLFCIIRQHRVCACACAAYLHVVACVLLLCVLHAFLWTSGNKCLQHAKPCLPISSVCSMCNSDNPCHLHVCACDGSAACVLSSV